MHIKNMHEMIEKLTECTKSAIEGNQAYIGQYPISEVVDMIEKLSKAEYYSKISKAMEKAEKEDEAEEKYMLQRMKEEYGEDNGQRYYNDWRYANGRYAPKGRGSRTKGYTEPIIHDTIYPLEVYRDWDRWNGNGMERMYFTDKERHDLSGYNDDDYLRGYSDGQRSMDGMQKESRYDKARRGYTDTKSMHKSNSEEDNKANLKDLGKLVDAVEGDINELSSGMTASEKTLLKTRLQNMAQKVV